MKKYRASTYYNRIERKERMAALAYIACKEITTPCDYNCGKCERKEPCEKIMEFTIEKNIPATPKRETIRSLVLELLLDLSQDSDGYESWCYDRAISNVENIDELDDSNE